VPATIRLKQVYPGIDPATRSLRVWLYAGPVAVPDYPAAMGANEVALAQAHFCVFDGYPTVNASGAPNLPRQVFDTGPQTLQEAYPQATTAEDAITLAFPPPGAD
jgi:hypothetical protein